MKINHILIENFVNHPKTELFPNKINMILGNNQEGKSAIRDAISFGLTGQARGMSGKSGKEFLVKRGSNKATVEISSDDLKVLRNTNNKLMINEKPFGLKDGQKKIFNVLDLNIETLQVLFDTGKISSMDSDSRKAYFSKIFKAKTDTTEFSDILRKKGVSQEIISSILMIYDKDGLKGISEYAVEKRRESKRLIKEWELEKAPYQIKIVEGKEYDLEKIKLTESNKYLNDLKAKLFTKENERDEIVSAKNRLEWKEQALNEKEASLKRCELFVKDNKEKVEELKKIQAEKYNIQNKYDSINVERVTEKVKQVTSLLETVKTLDLCAACSKKLDNNYSNEINNYMDEEASLVKKKKKLGEEIKSLESKSNLIKLLDDYEKAEEDIKRYMEDILKMRIELEPEKASGDFESLHKKISELKNKIKIGNVLVFNIEEYEKESVEYLSIQSKIAKANIDIVKWDELAKFVNPENNDLVNPIYEQLSERIKYTSGLFNSDISIDENTWDIIYKDAPIEFCSNSEKYEAGMIIQDAVSYLLDVGILFLDGAEIFTGERKSILTRAILRIAEDYNNVFLFASIPDKPKEVNTSENITTYWVEKGTVMNLTDMVLIGGN